MPYNKRTKIKRYYSPLARRNFKFLLSMRNKGYEGLSITFRFHDGSKEVVNTNPQFFKNERGFKLSVEKVIENINALKHDYSAKDYVLM